jgi:FAD/FMN-containing dehydrogenase
MRDVNLAASKEDLYILSGGSMSVSYGGYLTGGGHAALSSTYGMAADSVLELEIVSAKGDLMTINECQNQDLFWATRGVSFSFLRIVSKLCKNKPKICVTREEALLSV